MANDTKVDPTIPQDDSKMNSSCGHILGDYDYGILCKPRLNPWKKKNEEDKLKYYGPDEKLPLLLSLFLGFQHSLAVVGGTVIPGILLGSQDPSGKAGPYLVS